MAHGFLNDRRFEGIKPLERKVHLATPTMHGREMVYVEEAFRSGWVTTAGENIDRIEKASAELAGVEEAVALSCGTAAIHLAVKLAAERLYRPASGYSGALSKKHVFVSDLTFSATVNPVVYEGGGPVFIDSERDTWNMSPEALEKAFRLYPDVKLVIMAHLYGTPGKIEEIRAVCDARGALLIEDAAESFGAAYKSTGSSPGTAGRQTGSFGDYSVISFNGNKIITGSSGGMLLCHSKEEADRARKWSTQSREAVPWYQHEEVGYNYRMSNVVAGVVRGQLEHLPEHIRQKKRIYEGYRERLEGLPVQMNPFDDEKSEPNFWLSCLLVDEEAMCESVRTEKAFQYKSGEGKSCPDEILEALNAFGAEGRPVWKPMHMQPIYRNHGYVTAEGEGRGMGASRDIFRRGLCLPSDIKMTEEEQAAVIDIIHRCFR